MISGMGMGMRYLKNYERQGSEYILGNQNEHMELGLDSGSSKRMSVSRATEPL